VDAVDDSQASLIQGWKILASFGKHLAGAGAFRAAAAAGRLAAFALALGEVEAGAAAEEAFPGALALVANFRFGFFLFHL